MRSIVSLTARSLPGTGVAEKTTVSPECSSTSRWSLFAIRRSAESGSPCLPVELDRRVDHLLDAVDVGGEGGDDDPAPAVREGLEQGRADARLGGRRAGPVGVGGVAAEQQQPFAPEFG